MALSYWTITLWAVAGLKYIPSYHYPQVWIAYFGPAKKRFIQWLCCYHYFFFTALSSSWLSYLFKPFTLVSTFDINLLHACYWTLDQLIYVPSVSLDFEANALVFMNEFSVETWISSHIKYFSIWWVARWYRGDWVLFGRTQILQPSQN